MTKQEKAPIPSEEIVPEEMKKLVAEATAGCFLNFQEGDFLGIDWLELTGSGSKALRELRERFGDEGFKVFNRVFSPVLEKRLEEKIKNLKDQFDQLVSRVNGAPYSPRESEYQRLVLLGVADQVVTTDDYHAVEKPLAEYQGFLRRFRDGQPMTVYLDAGVEVVAGVLGSRGRFPKKAAQTIILQKPEELRLPQTD